ncbi:Putative multidrug export ATP-binding/permease protein [Sporomusa rhizae]|uniref:ABC transporter ATP-binding protein n=1 Tax=Sporomusa rhizae TaxID=357999 RepID=UPI00352B6ACA
MIKRFISYYRPHLPLFVLDFSCALIIAMLDLVFPLAVRNVIDKILPAGDVKLLLWAGAALLGIYLVSYVLNYIVDYLGHVLGAKMEFDMRRTLFDHVQKLTFRYFDNTKTGHIMSRIVNDLTEISEFAHHGPEDAFLVVVTMLGTLIILLYLNWELALITFALVPFMLWFTIVRNREMKSVYREVRLKIADINAQVEDSISGIRVVKSFANELYEQEKFERGNTGFLNTRRRALKIMARFYSGITLFTNVINLAVLIAGGALIFYGRLTVGELIGFLLYVGIFLQPIRKITFLTDMYQKGMAGFRRFIEIMDIEPDIVDAPNARTLQKVTGNIVFDNVTFSYNNHGNVLEGINLAINAGETVAFVGPSGGGKTTLCSLIPRFYEVDQGKITLDGTDIRMVTQKSLRENIGIVQQDVFLFSDTIRENIAYGKIGATEEEIITAAKLAHAHEFILSLEDGYDTFIGERGVKLSGGQKQRLAIARIFLKNPPILILDEATSALDNETEKIIQQALTKLAENRTTLIIAHRLATIRDADRIVVLTDEGIMEEGSHTELLAQSGCYARLYESQFKDSTPETKESP